MIKVVLDTNIFVSSIFWRGNPYKIVEKALDKKIKVYISIEIIKELEKILKRDFEVPEEYIERQINLILEYSEIVEINIKTDVVKEDTEDNKIIECAVSTNADYIITGDNHLLKLKEYKGIKILSPAKFLNLLE